MLYHLLPDLHLYGSSSIALDFDIHVVIGWSVRMPALLRGLEPCRSEGW